MLRIRQHLTYANVVATLAVFLAAGGATWAATSTSPVIHACAKKRGGALRIANRCRRNERALSWNQIGPIGPKGLTGARGSTGRTGTTGAPGAQGPTGKEGSRGEAGPAGHVRAYATITPGNPATIKEGAHGVVSAKTSGGTTCVILESSIPVASTSPIVTSKTAPVTFAASPGSCSEGEKQGVQVKGFKTPTEVDETETFSIVVP